MWGLWSHPVSGLTKETSPDFAEADHGALVKQLDHGDREPVPVEKSAAVRGEGLPTALRVEHKTSVPLKTAYTQKCMRELVITSGRRAASEAAFRGRRGGVPFWIPLTMREVRAHFDSTLSAPARNSDAFSAAFCTRV